MTALRARRATVADVLALQYGNRFRMLGTPLIILGAVVLFTIIVVLAIERATGDLSGTRYNSGVVWSLVGYIVAVGVQNVSTSFPFALALGSTRRTFVLGNLLTSATQAALVAVALLVLLGVERLTGGWFVGAAAIDVDALGNGDPLVVVLVSVLGMLTALSVGGLYGSAWVRFGARGPVAIALATAAVLVVALLIAAPALGALAAAFRPWWLAVAAVVVITVATTGQLVLLRRASVR